MEPGFESRPPSPVLLTARPHHTSRAVRDFPLLFPPWLPSPPPLASPLSSSAHTGHLLFHAFESLHELS